VWEQRYYKVSRAVAMLSTAVCIYDHVSINRKLLVYDQTAGASTFCEMQHLSKGMLNPYRGEREPFMKGGEEQKIVITAIM
jgi:hypothetical protein